MPPMRPDPNPRMPYQHPMPKETLPDLVVPDAIPKDERVWVPQGENVWFRPLCLNRSAGYWMNLLRVRKSGVLSRHRHPQAVHGLVLKGRWHYLEHDWVAEEGAYVFEPPGETHTLVVPEDVEEMITFFQVNGIMVLRGRLGRAARVRGRLHQDRHVPRALREGRARGGLCRPVHPLTGLAPSGRTFSPGGRFS